jgi:predicted AAA+ superfamily ATPase
MIDPRQFKKRNNKGKVILEADPDNGPSAVKATYTYFDKEGAEIIETERSTLKELQDVLAETNKDRNALQDIITLVNGLGIV